MEGEGRKRHLACFHILLLLTWMLIIYNYLYGMQRIEVSGIKQYQHQHTNPNAKFRKYLLVGYSIMTLQFNVILSNYL